MLNFTIKKRKQKLEVSSHRVEGNTGEYVLVVGEPRMTPRRNNSNNNKTIAATV